MLVGAREMEPGERERLRSSEIVLAGELDEALLGLRERVREVYLHLDLDVLDPRSVGAANEFAPTGGLTVEEAERAIRLVRERVGITAAGIASYDPAYDHDGAVLRAGIRLAGSLLD